jgi:MFS family permease
VRAAAQADLMEDSEYKKRKSTKWLYTTLPANIAMGPISTLIALYILALGGSVVNVAYAITIGTAISIPASFFWGKVADQYKQRKLQIVISYAGLALSLLGFYFTRTIPGVTLFYAVFSFIIVGAATPLNLLIIEDHPDKKWPSLFSRLQMISGIGSTIGFVIAAVVTGFLALDSLIVILLIIAIVSVVAAVKWIYEPSVKFGKSFFIRSPFVYLTKIFFQPIMIMILPEIEVVKGVINIARQRRIIRPPKILQNPMRLMYASSFIFFLGAGFFNTVYPAGLAQSGLAQSGVFLILFFGILVQTLTFRYSGYFVGNKSKPKAIKDSLMLRGFGYILIGAAFFALRGLGFFLVNSLLYLLAAGLAYAVFYTASNTLLFKYIGSGSKGSALGVYTAVMGVAGLAGALLSGYTSLYIGYWFTFSLAGLLVVASGIMFRYLPE